MIFVLKFTLKKYYCTKAPIPPIFYILYHLSTQKYILLICTNYKVKVSPRCQLPVSKTVSKKISRNIGRNTSVVCLFWPYIHYMLHIKVERLRTYSIFTKLTESVRIVLKTKLLLKFETHFMTISNTFFKFFFVVNMIINV